MAWLNSTSHQGVAVGDHVYVNAEVLGEAGNNTRRAIETADADLAVRAPSSMLAGGDGPMPLGRFCSEPDSR